MNDTQLQNIVEAVLLATDRPLGLEQLQAVFDEHERPEFGDIKAAIDQLTALYQQRPLEIKEVASGWRIQVREQYASWVNRLWEDKPGRYSRAFLETLALIAYRQPITRSEIEDVRGVSVNSNIMRTLEERGWIRAVGHRDVPGRPTLWGTTKKFLDHFNLRSLSELPALLPVRDLDAIEADMFASNPLETLPMEPTEEDTVTPMMEEAG